MLWLFIFTQLDKDSLVVSRDYNLFSSKEKAEEYKETFDLDSLESQFWGFEIVPLEVNSDYTFLKR
jgi:AAA15 family ATPase/GTPase